jgi:hypothetical protein
MSCTSQLAAARSAPPDSVLRVRFDRDRIEAEYVRATRSGEAETAARCLRELAELTALLDELLSGRES